MYDYVIIDEASQITEPAILSAVLLANKCIMIGDHRQLSPLVLSDSNKATGLKLSLFERLLSISDDNINN